MSRGSDGAATALETAAVEAGPAPDPDVEAMIGEAGPKGRRATRSTLRAILQHDPRWRGRLRKDLFRNQVVLDGQPLTDPDLTRTSCWIEEVYQSTPSRDLVHEVGALVAEDASFHSVRDYLAGLSWDGVERASSLLPAVLGVEDTPLHREMGRAFLVGMVARVQRPGCKLDTMLVLVGPQGVGKSRFCAGLLPEPAWFGDTPVDLRSKDAYLSLQGKWLYELAEMEAVRGRSATRVKSFLSSPTDTYRAPYARTAQDHPRQCVFIGTSNHAELFDDGTGSRRFWPVQVGRIDIDALTRDRDQLWAEARVRYERGEAWYLDPASERTRHAEASDYQTTDPFRERLEEWLEEVGTPFSTSDALVEGLGIPLDRVDHSLVCRIGTLLGELGCSKLRDRRREGGESRRPRMWQPPLAREE
jgi:predicted P-loop ATPase